MGDMWTRPCLFLPALDGSARVKKYRSIYNFYWSLYMSHKFLLTLGACSLVALTAACGPVDNKYAGSAGAVWDRADTTEDILAAEGSWAMVEDRQSAGDPVNLHSNARKQVNPANKAKRQFIPEERLAGVGGTQGRDDVHFRLVRIEREVSNLRGDFNKLLPPLSNLIVSDNELDKAIQEINARPAHKPPVPEAPVYNDTGTPSEALLDSTRTTQAASLQPLGRTAAAAAPAPAPMPRQAAAPAPKPASSGGATTVSALRTGEHPGKTRLVLDLTGESKYRADIDNDENLLLIELSDAGWSAASQKLLNHPLIKGYTTQPSGNGGTILALELQKPAKILGSAALKPNAQYGNRIYLDLAAS
jgi:hypothetical protein